MNWNEWLDERATIIEQGVSSRPGWDEWLCDIAATVATRAACTRRGVGAVITRDEDHFIISTGYNGTPSGMKHCGEGGCPRGELAYADLAANSDYSTPGSPGFCPAMHAEANACARIGMKAIGASIHITDAPCPNCLKALVGSGIARAVWRGRDGVMRQIVPLDVLNAMVDESLS